MKKKKIALFVSIGLLILVLVVGAIVGVVIYNKKTLPKSKVYGIEYKLLQSEISEASFDESSRYLTMDMDLHVTLRNATDKDFVFNPDVLYLNVDGMYVDGSEGWYETTFENGTKKLCYAEDLFVETQTIPTNNGICSLKTSISLKLYWPYAAWNSGMIERMHTLEFNLIYNREKVFKFSPNVTLEQVEGSLEG